MCTKFSPLRSITFSIDLFMMYSNTQKKNSAIFWDVTSCSVVKVNFYQTTRCNIPEDSSLHTHHR
jgi:hypothetical protein